MGDYVRVLAKYPRKSRESVFVGYVMAKDEKVGSISLRTKGRTAYAFQKSRLLKLDNVIKADIIKRKDASAIKKRLEDLYKIFAWLVVW